MTPREPCKTPAAPMPAIALPVINKGEFEAAAQRTDPAAMNKHIRLHSKVAKEDMLAFEDQNRDQISALDGKVLVDVAVGWL